MKKAVIFGSGNGSNFEAIIQYFKGRDIEFICASDKQDSYILERAKNNGIPACFVPYAETLNFLKSNNFDLVILAGYMRILPKEVVEFTRLINIHPSLLPSFKGKNAIKTAYESGVKVTGVTVHIVTEEMDAGPIIAQFPVLIEDNMSLDELTVKIHEAEHNLYPVVLDYLLFENQYNIKIQSFIESKKMQKI